jgi:hypothetical protein
MDTAFHQTWTFYHFDKPRCTSTRVPLTEVAMSGFSLESFLCFLGLYEREPRVFRFTMHTQSMYAPIELKSSPGVFLAYRLYAQKDSEVAIGIHEVEDSRPYLSIQG